ncbi:MAG: D-glycerate dehydrogenase [Candidatus Vogelbacteria bacterium]|nr:D-glycerate dehydrogenase [Candidatus Vogelbacteria bacterium]
MAKIFVTRRIPEAGIELLKSKGFEVDVGNKDGVLTREELLAALKSGSYDAVLCLLTDKIDAEVFAAAPTVKIFANYAVGVDNIDVAEAKKRGVMITNTPDVLTTAVAEHAMALIIAAAKRIVEADRYIREGHYHGWAPLLLLGTELAGKTLGVVGLGRIGSEVAARAAHGFKMKVLYYDVARNENFEKESGATFSVNVDDVLRQADFISIHVPLLPTTKHLINKERLALMKKSAILVNTSRGPVVDEAALVEALKNGVIRGAGLDVFENEPKLAPGLADLPNVVLTPHIASATEEARSAMSRLAAENIIAVLTGQAPPNVVS